MLALSDAALTALWAAPLELAPYDDANDHTRHGRYIERPALETNYPMPLIGPMYEQTLGRLKMNATSYDYLAILVAKSVKSALKQTAGSH